MKNKKFIFVLIGILAVCFIGTSVFFALQGISASNKKLEYFDVYRNIAEEYIKSNSEILNKYGDDISVNFDNTITYSESGERGFWDKYIEVFAPRVPNTIEEFTNGIETIMFRVRINSDPYEIVFEKNSFGELAVSDLSQSKP